MIDLLKEPIIALSWKQPFASLMLFGKIETRRWDTKYRGLVLICASKTIYTGEQLDGIAGINQWNRIINTLSPIKIEDILGKAIAVGRLVDSRPMKKKDEEKCFVQYYSDLFCHVYEEVKPIKPFAWKGAQKWKRVDQGIINQIEFI